LRLEKYALTFSFECPLKKKTIETPKSFIIPKKVSNSPKVKKCL
jgi:hypothetical protein